MVSTFVTKGMHGYAVEFSPYYANRLACTAGQHFGIAGCGRIFIIEQGPQGPRLLRNFDWNEGLFDLAWSENNENVVVTGGGDGGVHVWDVAQEKGPVRVMKEHTKEVYNVSWNQTRDTNFVLSASWDKTIKMWDIMQTNSVGTFSGHDHIVYGAVWSPLVPGCFASVSGDQTLRIWDTKKSYMAQIVIPAHESEIIACDWSKYDQHLLITGAVDCSTRGWDLRNFRKPVFECRGHQYAIRRLKTSPFNAASFVTCSYDFTVRTWNYKQQLVPLETIEHHSEFVCGLDYNLHKPGELADCSWDETIKIFTPKSLMNT